MNKAFNAPTNASRHLSKSKKYYTYKSVLKDKENILGDIESMIKKICNQGQIDMRFKNKMRSVPKCLNRISSGC